ncbi:hypothetical protein NX059_010810 [Plenodomus lindquistii]|nr:hypothetical protein NX059_010810 [Plenodomus lindquistii]
MATGFDALIDSVLSEIALCGVQGAGSADFYRFIHKFYGRTKNNDSASGGRSADSGLPADGLGRRFYEQIWQWVCNHSDMRIIYQNEVRLYTLSEFEAAELHETGTSGGTSLAVAEQPNSTSDIGSTQPSKTLLSMGGALRERLSKETHVLKDKGTATSSLSVHTPFRQQPRRSLAGSDDTEPVFNDPEATVNAPRLYASQGRIWQALTGHGIDLKKVPSMEFVLLSLITARGLDGIAQTDLIRVSGQDKRSVPHRTDELARKGYIVKIPVQAGKVRTSLCVHNKFASQSHFMGSCAQEDVYREGSFVLSGFVHLIYNTFKDAGVVPTRELRNRLGVPMTTWNKRATQGALIRLDQTGMIKRFSVRQKKSEDKWLTCIRILRKPRDEDVMNLGFRRQGAGTGDVDDEEVLDDDADGDTLMRDLEVDTLEEDGGDTSVQPSKPSPISDSDRVPPQWTPDKFLANFAFDAVAFGGVEGWDSLQLRDRMVGPFWRRPLESYFTRLTDDWEKTQPMHLRHLAIIRDSRNTSEKKYLHYVYRTHGNFQKAVDAGAVHWAGVSHSTTMGPLDVAPSEAAKSTESSPVDVWGFKTTNPKDFERGDGAATLTEARKAIVHRRAYGPRWDTAISHEIGHKRLNEAPRSTPKYPRGPQKKKREADGRPTLQSIKAMKQQEKERRVAPILSLSIEQRVSLGLKPHGRLSKHAEKQIAEHRQATGDPTSLPDKITDGPSRGGQPPLMTAEERIAAGLPPRGRLGIKQENAIRVQRGLEKITTKAKKRDQKVKSEPTVLSKQQRIDLKWIDHGRLPQDLIEGLRQERREGVALKDSKVIALYDEVMKAAKVAKDMKDAAKAGRPYVPEPVEPKDKTNEPAAPPEGEATLLSAQPDNDSIGSSQDQGQANDTIPPVTGEAGTQVPDPVEVTTAIQDAEEHATATLVAENPTTSTVTAAPGKWKARSFAAKPKTPKRRRTKSSLAQEAIPEETMPEEFVQVPATTTPETQDRPISPPQTVPEQSLTTAPDVSMIDALEPRHTHEDGIADSETQLTRQASEPTAVNTIEVASSSAPTGEAIQDQPQAADPENFVAEIQASEIAPSPMSVPGTASAIKKSFVSLAIVPPELHKLKISEKAKYKWYTERSSPGVYFDHFSKHKVPRGRPRKAFIATFRLPGLAGLDWFRPGPVPQPAPQRPPVQREITFITDAVDEARDMRGSSGNSVEANDTIPTTIQQPVTGPPLPHETPAGQCTVTSSAGEESQSISSTVLSRAEPMTREANPAGSSEEQSGATVPHFSQNSAKTAQVDSQASLEQASNQPPTTVTGSTIETDQTRSNFTSLPPRTVAGWTPVNGIVPSGQPAYESPYGPKSNSNTVVQAHIPGCANTTATVLPAGATNPFTNSALRRTSSGPVKPKPRASRKKTKKPQTIGSALFFRRQIIWDIIDMCKGVFPDQGEIGRPFSKLWDERHGHVQGLEKPIASTVNETMRNMCMNPAFGIKRMVFQVRMNYKKGPYITKKAIIARTHLDASSPDVLKLAHNITNFSHERSQQYFPEEVRHLLDDTSLYMPVARAPRDESLVLNPNPRELEAQIKEARIARRRRLAEQRKFAAAARKAQNASVEEVATKKDVAVVGKPLGKRTRLASLNDKNTRFRRAPLRKVTEVVNEESETTDSDEASASAKKNPLPVLIWTKPIIGPTPTRIPIPAEDPSTSDDDDSDQERPAPQTVKVAQKDILVQAEPSTVLAKVPSRPLEQESSTVETVLPSKGKKRVRISEPASRLSRKRLRKNNEIENSVRDPEYIDSASTESDATFSSEAEDDSDDGADEEPIQNKPKPKKRTYKSGRQRGKAGPAPTLLERLTGLTGDPNDPIYLPPDRQRTRVGRSRSWNHERKKKRRGKRSSERISAQKPDSLDRFKKLCCTLVIATSMSGEEGVADWSIIEKVYSGDKLFDVAKTRKIWDWMQREMSPQVTELTESFQALFLEAYEQGEVGAIEDPDTHDWTGLVRWATRACTYPEVPLPLLREALQKFKVDESEYTILDRAKWYRDKVADRSRTLLQLQHSFVAPLHRNREASWSQENKTLKARSWIRANTATSQAVYNGKQAHDKLTVLGEDTLVRVVGDLVEKRHLRMRKLKRLLPGRNYSFTRALAKKYVRQFELGDFMAAVKVKKEMDVAFADEDPSKRFYSISRLEEDGPIAAIMTMVSEGLVKLVPQLPPVDNEFGAPLPRLSIWGFCEGDYIHRAIDRERMFWDIYVVPTAKYHFGNPLQTPIEPLAPGGSAIDIEWDRLPGPPLPGKDNPDALLPIWSSIDGQSVTWPWWYRILNLVLQPLIFQPGATSSDIFSHCAEHTTEIFEIELILSWLLSVDAVRKTVGGGYITQPGWWATFGDKLQDVEDDWFGEHVKRKGKLQEKQQWREEYNLRHSTLQARGTQDSAAEHPTPQRDGMEEPGGSGTQTDTAQQIMEDPKKQYSITQKALETSENSTAAVAGNQTAEPDQIKQATITGNPAESVQQPQFPVNAPPRDTEMIDLDAEGDADEDDAHGEDVDAEGEIDDAMY